MSNTHEVHELNSHAGIGTFGSWLLTQSRHQTPISVALREGQMAFATLDDAYVLDLTCEAAPLMLGTIQERIIQNASVRLYARDLGPDLLHLTRYLSKALEADPYLVYRSLATCFVGDLTTAGQCVNYPVQPGSAFQKIEHDVFDTALLVPQYEHGIAKYYQAIALPMARQLAEGALFGEGEYTWWVTYHHLWLRVLASATGDPTLLRALQEPEPFAEIAKVLNMTPVETEAVLLFQACGRDFATFQRRFHDRLNDLPRDLAEVGRQLDIMLPVASSVCASIQRAYYENRQVTTLYERRLRPGNGYGEAVAFHVFGTVEEILGVAAVALMNNRPSPEILVTGFEGGPSSSVIRVAGVGRKGLSTWADLRDLMTLANPLRLVPLDPQIVIV